MKFLLIWILVNTGILVWLLEDIKNLLKDIKKEQSK